jgi:hypothetical protein
MRRQLHPRPELQTLSAARVSAATQEGPAFAVVGQVERAENSLANAQDPALIVLPRLRGCGNVLRPSPKRHEFRISLEIRYDRVYEPLRGFKTPVR